MDDVVDVKAFGVVTSVSVLFTILLGIFVKIPLTLTNVFAPGN